MNHFFSKLTMENARIERVQHDSRKNPSMNISDQSPQINWYANTNSSFVHSQRSATIFDKGNERMTS